MDGAGGPGFIGGGGELGRLIRAKDWSGTPIGAPEGWPQSLRTAVSLCLASNVPINIIWGPEAVQIYNDGFRDCCGDAHPRALGEDYRVTWASAWTAIGESFDRARAGEATCVENQRMFLRRLPGGGLEETFFTFSHSPIRDETGGIGGVFHLATETTATMLAGRRTRALRDLAARLSAAADAAEVARETVAVLSAFAFDLPFLLHYVLDPADGAWRLAAHHGIAAGGPAPPAAIPPGDAGPWPFAEAARTRRVVAVEEPGGLQGGAPCGPYEEPPRRAFVIPADVPGADRPPAILVAGMSPRLRLDDACRGFYDLLGVTLSGALAAVRAREEARRRAEAFAGEAFVGAALRRLPDAPSAEQAGAGPGPWRDGAADGDRPSVLLADDDAEMRDHVRRVLAGRYEVEAVADGAGALAAARARRPDLVLADATMPRLDGFGLLRSLRADRALRDVPVILLSARAGEEARVEGLEAGADDHLAKPFGARELVARVDTNLKLARIRRDATGALRRSEERLRRVLETDAVGVIFFDRSGTVVDANDVFVRLTGYSRADIAAGTLTWRRMTPPEWVAESERQMEMFAATGRIGPYEKEYILKDGSRRWMLFAGRDLGDGTIAEFCIDITARRRAEAALRESEERYRTLFGSIDSGFCVIGLRLDAPDGRTDYRVLEANPAFFRHTGFPEAIMGRWLREAAPALEEHWYETYGRVARTGQAERFERGSDMLGRWFDVHAFRIGAPQDCRVAVLFNDISARRAAERRLRELNETLEREVAERTAERDRMWATSPDLMVVIDFSGYFRQVNPAWTALLGYAREELVGHHVNEFVLPDDHGETVAAYESAAAGGRPRIVNRYRHKDGSTRWISWVAAPAGDMTYATGRDVTREKEREAELAQAQEALRQSQKLEAIGQLTGGIAHDFNNMLQGVAGGLDMARRRMEAGRSAEAARYLDAARDATGRAAGLTRRLLAFARQQRLEPRPLDPDALVRGMADMLRRTIGPAVALALDLRDGGGFVACDPNELESALLNLCINARDAMPDGGRLVVSVRDRTLSPAESDGMPEAPQGAFVEIAVADTGTGMPPDVLERALDPFFTTKPLGRGTGLGLSQVYGFARQSGGALRIESSPGRGTTVRLRLPLSARTDEAGEAPADAAVAMEAEAGATLLIVDDETGVRGPAAARLRDLGYTVVEAGDGAGALGLLKEGLRPDLLVTDVGLPGGMDGGRVAEAARQVLPGLPVLFMTGYATAALPLGADVVAKPFTLDALTARVRAALAGKGAGRA